MGVPEDIATRDACRMEHYVSSETFEAMKKAYALYEDKVLRPSEP